MIVVDTENNKYYELYRSQCARFVGVNQSTLYRWEIVNKEVSHRKGKYLIIFANVHRQKQLKGNNFRKKA